MRCRIIDVSAVRPIRYIQASHTAVGTASMAVQFFGTGDPRADTYLLFLAAHPARIPLRIHGVDGGLMLPPQAMFFLGAHNPRGLNAPYLVIRLVNDPSLHGIPFFDQAIVVGRSTAGFHISMTNLDCFQF